VTGEPIWDSSATRALAKQAAPAAYTLMHAHARLKTEDRDRLARGLAKTLGSTPQQEADGRER
jgi:hypothetical protein